MEVRYQMSSSPPLDFAFRSGRSSPSSSPQPFPNRFFFLSAPTSPDRELDDFSFIDQASPEADDFAFHVSQDIETPSVSAEELFDSGRIRSLIAPTETTQKSEILSAPESPPLSKSKEKKSFWSAFTTRRKKQSNSNTDGSEKTEEVRGRNRGSTQGNRARSLSPMRVSKYPWEEEKKAQPVQSSSTESEPMTLSTSLKSSKRWKLKDLLLFRSASEGRAAEKDPLRKLTALYSRQQETKSSSFGSVSRRGPVSAHERHYALKKAVSEDMKKKTFLPYKQGILGSFHGFGG